jgi:PqqD family protein of HPr-rel-A system
MTESKTLQLNDTVVRAPDVYATTIDGDVVVFNVEKGQYYGMQNVGVRIWELIEQPASIDAVCQVLMTEFSIDQPTCEAHVLKFLGELLEAQLIEVRD